MLDPIGTSPASGDDDDRISMGANSGPVFGQFDEAICCSVQPAQTDRSGLPGPRRVLLARAMNPTEIALPVRPGEHACCRFARSEDRERLTVAFIRAGLSRGYKVIYLRAAENGFAERLAAADERIAPALAAGQLEIRSADDADVPDGGFEPDRMAELLRTEHTRALARGFDGIAVTGDLSVICGRPGGGALTQYAQSFDHEPFDPSQLLLCHCSPEHLAQAELAELAAHHDVDASPELAPIGREGALSAAHVRADHALRLAGELDFDGAPAVDDVLAAHFHGPLRFDLADLTFVDVAGMRALRGRIGQPVTIAGASDTVRRLAELLAWDTDPDVQLPVAA
jgi:ABC-type transporter Mla MlaB component